MEPKLLSEPTQFFDFCLVFFISLLFPHLVRIFPFFLDLIKLIEIISSPHDLVHQKWTDLFHFPLIKVQGSTG